MRTISISVIGFCLIAAACNNSGGNEAEQRTNGYTPVLKTREDSLMHEVMEGHDAGMAKMGSLIGAQKDVQKVIDSLQKLAPRAKAAIASYRRSLDSSLVQLRQAEDEMNAWMRGFKMDSAKQDKDLRIQYLESEKGKVTRVKDDILQSLQTADSLLKRH